MRRYPERGHKTEKKSGESEPLHLPQGGLNAKVSGKQKKGVFKKRRNQDGTKKTIYTKWWGLSHKGQRKTDPGPRSGNKP